MVGIGVALGVFLILGGVGFSASPMAAARLAGHIRFAPVPVDPSERRLRAWRLWGGVIAAIGLALILIATL